MKTVHKNLNFAEAYTIKFEKVVCEYIEKNIHIMNTIHYKIHVPVKLLYRNNVDDYIL